ncbi:hypothetical protein HK100_004208, partial [Physocladia obscura]
MFEDQLFEYHISRLKPYAETFNTNQQNVTVLANISIEASSDDHPVFKLTGDCDGEDALIDEFLTDWSDTKTEFTLGFLNSLETIVQGTKEIFLGAASWFLDVWSEDGLLKNEDTSFRLKIFDCLETTLGVITASNPPPANREALQIAFKKAIALKSSSDIVQAMFFDVNGLFSDQELFDFAWRAFATGQPYRLEDAEFTIPSSSDKESLIQHLKDPAGRLDVISMLLSLIETQANLYMKSEMMRKRESSRTSAVAPGMHGMSIYRNEVNKNWRVVSKLACTKITWIFRFLN